MAVTTARWISFRFPHFRMSREKFSMRGGDVTVAAGDSQVATGGAVHGHLAMCYLVRAVWYVLCGTCYVH